jgi:hypothetical protein
LYKNVIIFSFSTLRNKEIIGDDQAFFLFLVRNCCRKLDVGTLKNWKLELLYNKLIGSYRRRQRRRKAGQFGAKTDHLHLNLSQYVLHPRLYPGTTESAA